MGEDELLHAYREKSVDEDWDYEETKWDYENMTKLN